MTAHYAAALELAREVAGQTVVNISTGGARLICEQFIAADRERERMRVALQAWREMRATPFIDDDNSTCTWSAAYMRAERLLDAVEDKS